MNIKLSIYVLWFLLINITFVLGQNEDLHFSYEFLNYTIEDGLPSNETYSIIQDDEGYLWISTDNGVSKYNGYEFENFTTEDGLIDNTIFKMFKDDKGRIWMPGYNGKLCYYENGKFIAYKYNNVLDSLQKKLLTSALITDLYIHKDFVFVKYDFGYNCIDNKGKVVDLKTKKFYLLEGVNQIIINEDNYFLNKLIYLNLSSKNDFLNLKLSEDNKEKTKNYPCSYNFQKQTFYAYSTFLFIDNDFIDLKSHIYSMRSMNTHTLLVCTNNKIIEIDIKEKKITRTFLNENSISSAFQDLNGGWWFASTNKGLFYLINTDILKLYSNNNIVDDIFPISYKEKNNLYFYDYHQKQNYKLTNKSISKCENVINVDKLDVNSYNYDLSFSPFDAKFNNESFSNAHFNGVLSFCYRDSNLVYANRNAVLFYDLSIEKLDNFFIKDFMTMQYLANKRVFIGTKTQAFVLDLSTMKILNKPINTSNSVKALMIMPNLDTIIGFNGSGLNILSIDSNYFLNSENSELLSNSINNFLLVNDKLWIATSSGLNSISYNDEKDLIIQNELNQYQGLLTSRIRQIVIKDKIIYLGTDQGLYQYLNNPVKNSIHYEIFKIKKFNVNGKEIAFDSKIQLKYNQNNLNIKYEAISFSQNGEILYRYRLKGLFDEWKITKERNLDFFKLNSGNYRFEIQYQLPNKKWSKLIIKDFKINTPFWKTLWFISLLFVSIVASLLLLFFDYKKRQQLKFDSYQSIQMALAAQMNPHFVFNALNSLQNYILKNESDLAQNYLIKFARLIRIVFENSKKSFIPLSYELEALSLYIALEQKRFDIEFVYELQNELEQQEIFVPPLIIQPFVENAIWHGLIPKDGIGLLKISIKSKNEKVVIEISDNGIGYTASKSKKKNVLDKHRNASGLSKTFERIRLLEKQYNVSLKTEITDLPNFEGTLVKIELPKFINDPKV